jgi:GTP cyclohydrolase I
MLTTEIKRFYDPTFTVSPEYKDSLPDLQNGPASLIEGANVPIQQVGISNFKLPLNYVLKNNKTVLLETNIDGYVSLDAGKKGINMSRIMRVFYEYQHESFNADTLKKILIAYKNQLESKESFLKLSYSLPLMVDSLRSGLQGYQYYNIAMEGHLDENNVFTHISHVEFIYSSACPCSYELAEHARQTRGVATIPHSQRSVANVSVRLRHPMYAEDLIQLCRDALKTETQVMVKREDEQAFAELNGAYQKFVEDAARLLYDELDQQEAVADFVVRCAHLESLHSHDAISRICKGVRGGMR